MCFVIICINCTVVELKRNIVLYASYALFCINCTVVELKHLCYLLS